MEGCYSRKGKDKEEKEVGKDDFKGQSTTRKRGKGEK